MQIDKHVPLPAPRAYRGKGGVLKYPFREMVPGDSAFFPGEHKSSKHHPAFMTARNYVKRHGWRITTRAVVEDGVKGIRIWRVE